MKMSKDWKPTPEQESYYDGLCSAVIFRREVRKIIISESLRLEREVNLKANPKVVERVLNKRKPVWWRRAAAGVQDFSGE